MQPIWNQITYKNSNQPIKIDRALKDGQIKKQKKNIKLVEKWTIRGHEWI